MQLISANIPGRASRAHLSSCQEPKAIHPDSISLYAHGSLFNEKGQLEFTKKSHDLSSSHPEGSASADDCSEEPSSDNVFSRILSAAKILGLETPMEAPSSTEGVWDGISQPRPSVAFPAAEDNCKMQKKAWKDPSQATQFNLGCTRMSKAGYPSETGLASPSPVEKEMAALTALSPEKVTADPQCPGKECDKTDCLVCRTYNAAARAACAGNALAILLAAIMKT